MNPAHDSGKPGNFGTAWFLLCLAFCAHVADEALTGFLPVYNATVLVMRSRYNWFPMPNFGFREWLTELILANIVLRLLTPFAFQNAEWLRPLAYFYAFVHLLNGMGHTVATIFDYGPAAGSGARPRVLEISNRKFEEAHVAKFSSCRFPDGAGPLSRREY